MKFQLGFVAMTRGIAERYNSSKTFYLFINQCVGKHSKGKWGEVSANDKYLNDLAVANGGDRIFSCYKYRDGKKIYIITEWDRSATTILYADEY